jgi:hypothetical protein
VTEPDIVADVMEAVAAVDGVDLAELDVLYNYIDPDALDALSEQGEWTLTFQFSDHQITVNHESQILVDGVKYTPDTLNYSEV